MLISIPFQTTKVFIAEVAAVVQVLFELCL